MSLISWWLSNFGIHYKIKKAGPRGSAFFVCRWFSEHVHHVFFAAHAVVHAAFGASFLFVVACAEVVGECEFEVCAVREECGVLPEVVAPGGVSPFAGVEEVAD